MTVLHIWRGFRVLMVTRDGYIAWESGYQPRRGKRHYRFVWRQP